jgi:hypothetical protein
MRHEQDFIGIGGLRRFAGITRVLARNGFGMLSDRLVKRSATRSETCGPAPVGPLAHALAGCAAC